MIYCLDTDILIEYFRGNESIKTRIENLREDDTTSLTWLSVYEFFKGIFASGKLEEEQFLSALVNSALLIDQTYESSRIGGEIYAYLKKSGTLINDADIRLDSEDRFKNWHKKDLRKLFRELLLGSGLLLGNRVLVKN